MYLFVFVMEVVKKFIFLCNDFLLLYLLVSAMEIVSLLINHWF